MPLLRFKNQRALENAYFTMIVYVVKKYVAADWSPCSLHYIDPGMHGRAFLGSIIAALSCLVFVPPLEEFKEERGLVSRTAA